MRLTDAVSGRLRTAAVLAVAVHGFTACGPAPLPLNSERIEQRFGTVGVEVLYDKGGLRRVSLYSVHDGRRVCRTYAVVRLLGIPSDTADAALLSAHQRIVAGASLGATLEQAGWQVDKQTHYVGQLPDLDPGPDWIASMGRKGSAGLAVHVYRLRIKNSSEVYDYADIVEVHHPDYLDVDALAALYPVTAPAEDRARARAAALKRLAAGH